MHSRLGDVAEEDTVNTGGGGDEEGFAEMQTPSQRAEAEQAAAVAAKPELEAEAVVAADTLSAIQVPEVSALPKQQQHHQQGKDEEKKQKDDEEEETEESGEWG